METGSFGYKIGRKLRLMRVEQDANLLWQICVREIYVLMKHFATIDALKEVFENLKEVKGNPKPEAIEKCRLFTSEKTTTEKTTIEKKTTEKTWDFLLRYCQHSFINMLESGYILNNGENSGLVFILDFNTNSVIFYGKKSNTKNNIQEYESAKIEEIMEFEDMPTKTYTEIITDMKERFKKYDKQVKEVDLEIEKIHNIIKKAKELGNDQNVMSKAKDLLYDMEWERKKLVMEYRYFYHRLDALNLIDHTDN